MQKMNDIELSMLIADRVGCAARIVSDDGKVITTQIQGEEQFFANISYSYLRYVKTHPWYLEFGISTELCRRTMCGPPQKKVKTIEYEARFQKFDDVFVFMEKIASYFKFELKWQDQYTWRSPLGVDYYPGEKLEQYLIRHRKDVAELCQELALHYMYITVGLVSEQKQKWWKVKTK